MSAKALLAASLNGPEKPLLDVVEHARLHGVMVVPAIAVDGALLKDSWNPRELELAIAAAEARLPVKEARQ